MMGEEDAKKEVDRIFKSLDVNHTGAIDFTGKHSLTPEFLLATVNHKKLLSNERLSQVFKMFDKDGNGSISRQEIKEFFSMQDSSEDFVHDLVKEVDENGDGEVDLTNSSDTVH